MGLEWGPLSLVTTIWSYLKEKVADLVCKTQITAVGIRQAEHATTLYPQKLAITSPTNGGRSVRIVSARTKMPEFLYYLLLI
jgi:hypothetical protein